MTEEIYINCINSEVRVAVVVDKIIQQIFVERNRYKSLVGNIYIGKVLRVLPGIQSAFIDIGLDKAGFLHVSDMEFALKDEDKSETEVVDTEVQYKKIEELLTAGERIAVQVAKDALGSKGPRLTTCLSLPGRYTVLLPNTNFHGVSQRITDEAERDRLQKAIIDNFPTLSSGFIIRTLAQGIAPDNIIADFKYLNILWQDLEKKVTAKQLGMVYEELSLPLRTLRDIASDDTNKIVVDNKKYLQQMQQFTGCYMPQITNKIFHHNYKAPIFSIYDIEGQIKAALLRKVELKSGGYLVFEQTEAMTTVDVNTGAFVSGSDFDETIFKTNLEAAAAIAWQIKLRNIGGIIIIDFIDMINQEHKAKVLQAFEKALDNDSAKARISGISELGLLEMTRKRTQESLENMLCEPCPHCNGRKMVKTTVTMSYEIFRQIINMAQAKLGMQLLVLAAPAVVDYLLEQEQKNIKQLEQEYHCKINLQTEPAYFQEEFDVISMKAAH